MMGIRILLVLVGVLTVLRHIPMQLGLDTKYRVCGVLRLLGLKVLRTRRRDLITMDIRAIIIRGQ